MDPIILQQFELFRYRLNFRKPFSVKKEMLSVREGLILKVTDSIGGEGWGEAAPLPGLSPETLDKSRHQLKTFLSNVIPAPAGLQTGSDWIPAFAGMTELSSSASFCWEAAVLNLVARRQGKTIAEFLGCQNIRDVSTACLLQGAVNDVVEAAEKYSKRGFKTFKLKVGDRNVPLDVKKVDVLQKVLPKDCQLRLDANAVWTLSEAIVFAKSISHERVSFIEEPFAAQSPEEYAKFHQDTRMPYALDESLLSGGRNVIEQKGLDAIVLKPTVVGGISKTLEWIKFAQKNQKKVVISSCFESGVGLTTLANLALLTGEPAGLGTLEWFKDDVLIEPLIDKRGIISKEKLVVESRRIRQEKLEEL